MPCSAPYAVGGRRAAPGRSSAPVGAFRCWRLPLRLPTSCSPARLLSLLTRAAGRWGRSARAAPCKPSPQRPSLSGPQARRSPRHPPTTPEAARPPPPAGVSPSPRKQTRLHSACPHPRRPVDHRTTLLQPATATHTAAQQYTQHTVRISRPPFWQSKAVVDPGKAGRSLMSDQS